jgi:hypothetical protein
LTSRGSRGPNAADAIRHLEQRLTELEARQCALEDDRAIRELLGRYGFYADVGEHDRFVDLFTEDGVIELVGGAPAGVTAALVSWTGRAELREFIGDPEMHMKIEGRCMHLPAMSLRTEIDGDAAVASTCSIVVVKESDGLVLYGAGFTAWSLVKVDGRWLIRKRRRVAIGTPGLSATTAAGAASQS